MNVPTREVSAFSRVRVRYMGPDGPVDRTFEGPFRIGRDAACELTLASGYVSRSHVEITYENGQWVAKDLNSSNGLYAGGQRVQSVGIGENTTIRLGQQGPELELTVEVVPGESLPPGEKTIVANYIAHYFDDRRPDGPVGEHTMFVRRAFQQVQKKQRRKY